MLSESARADDRMDSSFCEANIDVDTKAKPECQESTRYNIGNNVKEKSTGPISEQATALSAQIAQLIRKLDDLKQFNAQELINNSCDQLELDVIEAVESAHKRINDLEKEWMEEIKDYREKCLSSWSPASTKDLEEISLETERFNAKWTDYCNGLKTETSEREVKFALYDSQRFLARIEIVKSDLMKAAFGGIKLEFKQNEAFLLSKKYIGHLQSTKFDHILEKNSKLTFNEVLFLRRLFF